MATSPSTLPEFIAALKDHADAPLVFSANEMRIRAGYHVTELKHAAVKSVDCGGNLDAWDETIVQLLDGHGADSHMTAGKFSEISRRSQGAIPNLENGRLRFEYAPQNGPTQVFTVGQVDAGNNSVLVQLSAEHVACKPAQSIVGCCGANAKIAQSSSCGAG